MLLPPSNPLAGAGLARPFGRALSGTALRAAAKTTTCAPFSSNLVQSRPYTNSPKRNKDFFVEHPTKQIRLSPPAWPHPEYTDDQMKAVEISHRETRNWSDWTAFTASRFLRFGLDTVTNYKHDKGPPKIVDGKPVYAMTARKYLIRNVFLESVAGVPGMVAGMVRHLHSMRRMRRDLGWIETCLEESYNERIHLLTFLALYKPGWFMRLAVLVTQGVFFNGFFLAYLISPRTAHRFVGYIEEEAVKTYSREIEELEAGKLPEWNDLAAPDVAVEYYKMPEGKRKMLDLLYYIRADESKHREVNHTLGNLHNRDDPNPYVSEYRDPEVPHPSKDLRFQKPQGWERKDVI